MQISQHMLADQRKATSLVVFVNPNTGQNMLSFKLYGISVFSINMISSFCKIYSVSVVTIRCYILKI